MVPVRAGNGDDGCFGKAANHDQQACPSRAARIQRFTILPRDFSVNTDELTATLKLKRSVVMEKYAEAIDAMYDAVQAQAYVPLSAGGGGGSGGGGSGGGSAV
jgi:hypothetical protein